MNSGMVKVTGHITNFSETGVMEKRDDHRLANMKHQSTFDHVQDKPPMITDRMHEPDIHLPLRTIRLHKALSDFRSDPSEVNNDRILLEMRGPNAEVFILTHRPITDDGPALCGEDIVIMNNEAGQEAHEVQVTTGIDPVAMEHLYGGWDGIYLSLVPTKDVLRACEERGIAFLLVDKGHRTETSIGGIGGTLSALGTVQPCPSQSISEPRRAAKEPVIVVRATQPRGPMGKLRQLWHR